MRVWLVRTVSKTAHAGVVFTVRASEAIDIMQELGDPVAREPKEFLPSRTLTGAFRGVASTTTGMVQTVGTVAQVSSFKGEK